MARDDSRDPSSARGGQRPLDDAAAQAAPDAAGAARRRKGHAGAKGAARADARGHSGKDGGKGSGKGLLALGFRSLGEVRQASKESAAARQALKDLEGRTKEQEKELARRDDVMANYDRIVSEETREQADAQAAGTDAAGRSERLAADLQDLKASLAREKAANEEALRPYRQLADTARGRSEDATRALGEAKRAVKAAEGQLDDAKSAREQGIASANRTLDNSQARLQRARDEQRRLKDSPDASAEALGRVSSDVASELAHVDSARKAVEDATRDGQAAVEQAQQRLFELRRSLEDATTEADAAKADSEARRGEYDRMSSDAQAREKAIQDRIDANERDSAAAKDAHEKAQSRLKDSRAILEDAQDVHDHPEVTEELRGEVARLRASLEAQRKTTAQLTTAERQLRKRTRGARAAFVAACVAAVAAIVLIAYLVVGAMGSSQAGTGGASSSSSEAPTSQTRTAPGSADPSSSDGASPSTPGDDASSSAGDLSASDESASDDGAETGAGSGKDGSASSSSSEATPSKGGAAQGSAGSGKGSALGATPSVRG